MKKQITHDDIIALIEELAQQHKEVKSFYRWDFEEFDMPVRPNTNFPLLTYESPTLELSNTESNPFVTHQCAFNILGLDGIDTHDPYNTENQNKVLQSSQLIALEIARKLIERDGIAFSYDSTPNKWYSALDILTFEFVKIGPVTSDYLYGYRCEFSFKSKFTTKPNPEKWK